MIYRSSNTKNILSFGYVFLSCQKSHFKIIIYITLIVKLLIRKSDNKIGWHWVDNQNYKGVALTTDHRSCPTDFDFPDTIGTKRFACSKKKRELNDSGVVMILLF